MLRRLAILELLARHTGRSYHTAILHRGPQKHLLRSPTLVNRLPHVTHTRKALFSSDNSVIRKENNENKSTEEQQEEPVKRPRSFHDIDVNDELQEEFNKRKEEKKRRKKANQEDREEGEEEEDMEDEEDEEMPKRKKRSGAKIIGQLMMGGAIVGLLLFATSELYKNFVKPEHKDLSTVDTLKKIFSFGLNEPIVKKLLPELDEGIPPQRIRPVLVINVDDLLVHLDYNPEDGWKCQKRPGVDDFLAAVTKHFEVVLFSDSGMYKTGPVAARLDAENRCHKLFKEHTALINGYNVKNLDLLNRPIEKVLMVDHNAGAYHLHPRNTIRIKPWKSDTRDDTLKRLAPFLATIANYVQTTQMDVRDVIDQYKDMERKEKEGDAYVEDLEVILEKYEKALEAERQRLELLRQQSGQSPSTAAKGKAWYKIW